jgi:AraC-like DNA-binding protein
MRIEFLPASLARLIPERPVVFLASQLRIYQALVLLADVHDTTRVARACGWANPSGFIAAFTEVIGATPGRYRASRQPLRGVVREDHG